MSDLFINTENQAIRWEARKLGDISTNVTSGSRDWAQYYADTGSIFLRMTNLRRDGISLKLDDIKYVNVQSNSSDGKRTSLVYGDILVSITAELGKIGWIPEGFGEAFINQHTALVRVNKTVADHKFIAYLLSSRKMNKAINRMNDAGAKAGLNLPTIRSLRIDLPPLPEQTKIAKILSTWDKAINTVEKLIENSKQQKKSLMQQLLTGKKRFKEFGEPAKDGALPEGWKTGVFSDLAEIVMGQSPQGDTYNVIGHGTPLINGPTEFTERYPIKKQWTTKPTKICKNGDVLFCVRGSSTGRINISNDEYCIGRGIAAIRAKENAATTEYVEELLYLAANLILAKTAGSTFPNIDKKSLSSIKISYPGLKESLKIAECLKRSRLNIDERTAQLEFLRTEKSALMQQLLTGKRRVKLDTPQPAEATA